MTPTEFEALAGRGSTKKWKESVKVGPDIPEFQGKAIGAYMRDQLGVWLCIITCVGQTRLPTCAR